MFSGFVLDAVHELVRSSGDHASLEMLRLLSQFEVDGIDTTEISESSIFAVASNIISRGLPTLSTCSIERKLSEALHLTAEDNDQIRIRFPFVSEISDGEHLLLLRSLAAIDPRVKERLSDAEPSMQGAEPTFFNGPLSEIDGGWVCQVVECQRSMSTIVQNEQDFANQSVDFSLSWPAVAGFSNGLVIEIDGSQHQSDTTQSFLDKRRDKALEKSNWEVVRIDAAQANNPPNAKMLVLDKYLKHPWAQYALANYRQPLWADSNSLKWMQAALVPLVIARVQKTILQLVINGLLDPHAPIWRIAFVERDVPGSHLAVEDIHELLENLANLEGQARVLPKIEFRVYRSAEFQDCEVAVGCEGELFGENPADLLEFDADVVLDVSVLQRPGYSCIGKSILNQIAPRGKLITIRSSYSERGFSKIVGGSPIQYVGADTEEGKASLRYFLNNIFRKSGFREKQLDIIKEPLVGNSVAGLLPTGAGKSVCYQLPALLQPGITIVVDPLKSLMRDQHDNLLRAGVETTIFLNSSLSAKERARAEDVVKRGGALFVFVSPERFLIEEFRAMLGSLSLPVTYCVIDEAHCVSEWGHDFRTAYLRLGKAARTFCTTKWMGKDDKSSLPIIALTGTASFDVLSDIKRELDFGGGVPEVIPKSFERKELVFEIVKVPRPILDGFPDSWAVRNAVFEQKRIALRELLKRLPIVFGDETPESFYRIKGEDTNSGLVFTPHAKNHFGVEQFQKYIEKEVPVLDGTVGRFASSDETMTEDGLEDTQDAFKSNSLGLLVATKAFGMGVDKPNIRYVVHANLSQSIESYYQEAGRAGRDRKIAHCFVLYCDQPAGHSGDALSPHTVDGDLIYYFHASSFKGIDHDMGALEQLLSFGAYAVDDPALKLDELLKVMPVGTKRVAVIPFSEDNVDLMAEYLTANVDQRLNRGVISRPYGESNTVDEFIAKLTNSLGGSKGKPIPDFNRYKNGIDERFFRRRDEKGTFKAVYRLSIIGLIDDYVVDYKAKVILARIEKLSESGYINNLRAYLARYDARENTRRLAEKVAGKDIIRGCLSYLLDFVYSRIEKKRKEAIRQMEEAVSDGARLGNKAFTARINTYFDSRYTEDLRQSIGESLTDSNLNVVWKYIRKTEGTPDNILHLRGACDRLLAAAPENGTLLLLRAFARCLSYEEGAEMFSQDFREGWRVFRNLKGLGWTEFLEEVNRFWNEVARYDSEATNLVSVEIAQIHADWLRSFNNKFLVTHNV